MEMKRLFGRPLGRGLVLLALVGTAVAGLQIGTAALGAQATSPLLPAPVVENDSAAQIETFYDTYGGRDTFTPLFRDAVETYMLAEDDVVAGDFATARARIDDVFEKYSMSDPVWTADNAVSGVRVGDIVGYNALRMLDEIARVGLGEPAVEAEPLTFTFVLVECASGVRPATPDLAESEPVDDLVLDQRLVADDYFVLRQSMQLFQMYVWAITGGERYLELDFQHVSECAEVDCCNGGNFAGIRDSDNSIRQLPEDVIEGSDMFLVTYPSSRPSDPVFESVEIVSGAMGSFDGKPNFIGNDTIFLDKDVQHGGEPYTDLERRGQLPNWLQHEYFHHLFNSFEEFDLEPELHLWFERSSWPDDFVGTFESDYFAEALNKRFYTATPSVTERISMATDTDIQSEEDLTGVYRRNPVENDWHTVEIVYENDELIWTNTAGVRCTLHLSSAGLFTDVSCPYGEQELHWQIDSSGNISITNIDGIETFDRVSDE